MMEKKTAKQRFEQIVREEIQRVLEDKNAHLYGSVQGAYNPGVRKVISGIEELLSQADKPYDRQAKKLIHDIMDTLRVFLQYLEGKEG
jgi:hypothetical protein